MAENERMELVREVAGLSTKMDVMITSVTELKQTVTSMPTRQEIDARFEKQGERTGRLESRVRDLEAAPHKWLSTLISLAGVSIAAAAWLTR